ncbi:MAG: penicillin-binding protein [Chloroflexi bacterium]|nr:MAG: penicillin-binding protein [Chloroflexota bacterium]
MTNQGNYRLEYLEKYQKQPADKKRPNSTPPKKKKPRGCMRVFLWLIQLGLIGLLLTIIFSIGGYIYLSNQLADAIDQVVAFRGTGLGGTPRFYDRNGNLLFELTPTEKRRWLAYPEIPPVVINATVAAEDDTFWTNPGFDPAAIVAAVISNFRQENGRPVGASTITQQLVRHIAFTYEERVSVSYERKLREIFLAFIMTRQRSKQEIIQMYLNEIYYGNLAYGIEAAAQTYFGKTVIDLTLAEAAFLAGLPQSPLQLDPYTNFEGAKSRQELILDLMAEDGYITPEEAAAAKEAPLTIIPRISETDQTEQTTLEAAHFVLYVQNELEKRYGPDALIRGGWQVVTSLDLNIQHMAEQMAREQVAARREAHDVSNAAVVVLKPGTGEILAMVGSLDYFDESIDGQVNVALSPRQPGSSIKPVTYAAAMERGWSTGDVLWDVPIKLDLGGGETMTPVNYDGRYHGPVLFRDALANSYNIPPVQLIRDIGIPAFIATARKMGIESLREPPGYYGLALTLGGGEVPLLEMTHAYATLANLGKRPSLVSVLKITDSRGNVIFDLQNNRLPPVNVLDPRIAYIITDILDDDQARVPAMGRNNPLELPFPAAAKTGTTNDFRDNWTIGYTPGVVVGVWMGNSDGHPMRNSSGLQGAAPLWRRIMEGIYADPGMRNSLMIDGRFPPTEFLRPDGIEERRVCLPWGTGGGQCTAFRTDLFIVGAPIHGIPRVPYSPNASETPGAWTLAVLPLPPEEAQRIVQPALSDGTQPPVPTYCVVNSTRPPEQATVRLYLPIPPYYPDEVRARLWARGTGFQMAPPTVCPTSLLRAASGESGSGASAGGESAPPVTGNGQYFIASPSPGAQLSGLVSIVGTADFNPAQVQYYKLEIGNGRSPTTWTTFGTTHNQPVRNGVLEQLHADALPPGEYTIRLVLVGHDGNFIGPPHTVPIVIVAP